jgi:hypothetical protein
MATRIETVLWWLTVACAIVLFFVGLTGRTRWVEDHANPNRATKVVDSAGWDWVARLAGIAAIGGLAVGRWARSRFGVAVLGAAATTAAFGWAAVVAGHYWLVLTQGTGQIEGYVMYPATGPPYVAVLATVGTGFALVLAISWLLPATERW